MLNFLFTVSYVTNKLLFLTVIHNLLLNFNAIIVGISTSIDINYNFLVYPTVYKSEKHHFLKTVYFKDPLLTIYLVVWSSLIAFAERPLTLLSFLPLFPSLFIFSLLLSFSKPYPSKPIANWAGPGIFFFP